MFSFFQEIIDFLQSYQDNFTSFQNSWYDFLGVLIQVFAWINAVANSFAGRYSNLFQYVMPAVFVALVNEWRKRNLGK